MWGKTPNFGTMTPMVGNQTPSYGSMTPGGKTPQREGWELITLVLYTVMCNVLVLLHVTLVL